METKLTMTASEFAATTVMTGQPTPARFRGEALLEGFGASAHFADKAAITADRKAAWFATGELSTKGEFPIMTVNTAHTTDYVLGSRYRSPLLMS